MLKTVHISPPIYRLEKLAVGAILQPRQLSVDRPGRPPKVRFLTVGASVDRPGRPWPGYREQSLCSVDSPVDQGLSREQSSLDGRPALQPDWRARSVHVDRPTQSTDSKLGRPAEARTGLL